MVVEKLLQKIFLNLSCDNQVIGFSLYFPCLIYLLKMFSFATLNFIPSTHTVLTKNKGISDNEENEAWKLGEATKS